MLAGMLLGTGVVAWAWCDWACAWTWYAFIGAGVTSLSAWILSFVAMEVPDVAAA